MLNVYSLSLVIVIFAGMWHKTEGHCGPRNCSSDYHCPPYYICLYGPNAPYKYCRPCPCNLKSQCYLKANGAIDCNCTKPLWGPHCNCPPCLGECPDGFSRFERTCQCYKSFTSPKLTWEDAKVFCENISTNLVMITSSEENIYVLSQLNETEDNYWIGGTNIGGTWVWSESNANVTYDDWDVGYPQITGDCMVMSRLDEKWKNDNCSIEQAFFCEYLYY